MAGYYTVEQVCMMFNVARETIRRWEHDGGFPRRVRLSRHARGRCGFPKAEVEAWDLDRRRARPENPPPDPHDE